jgi:hypothetical protein
MIAPKPKTWRKSRMFKQTRIWASSAVAVLLLAPLAGCGGDDEKKAEPVAGTFVGKVPDTKAFVAVAAPPAAKGQEQRVVTTFICDARSLCEYFAGSASGNDFTAKSDDGDAQAKGELSDKDATGTIELPGGKTVRYKATAAPATSGLYELTVSSNGKLRGASSAGVALTGNSTLPSPGNGTFKLADRTRLKFVVASDSGGDTIRLKAGQLRMIVLPGGELRGAGKNRQSAGGSNFFIRSSS